MDIDDGYDIEVNREMSVFDEEPIKFITDERFDFDLPLSPRLADDASECADNDDEDIFFGPMGHKEKCISVVVEEEAECRNVKPLSPLSAKEHAEIFKEAHTIAYMLEKTAASDKQQEENGSPIGSKTVTIKRTATRLSPDSGGLSALKRKLEDFNVDDDSCGSDSSKKWRQDLPRFNLPDSCDKTEEPLSTNTSAKRDRSERLSSIQKPVQKRLRLPSPKRRASNIKRSDDTQLDTSQNSSLLQPPRKRFALTSPEDDSKAIPRRSTESKRRSVESTRRSIEPSNSAQKPRALPKPASSLPAPKSLLKPPGSGIVAPKASGLKQPAASNISKLKAPATAKSGLQPPSQLQKPKSKLQLIKPNAVSMQRKAVHSEGKPTGPMKATASVQSMSSKLRAKPAITPMKAIHPVDNPESSKVLPEQSGSPPRQPSDSSATAMGTPVLTQSGRRRTCLPTPRRSVGSSSYRSSGSSISSVDSLASPAIRNSRLNDSSPSSMMPKRPLVQHTPIGGNKENKKLSAWSPVRRPKPISLEDEVIQCTKRNTRLNNTHF